MKKSPWPVIYPIKCVYCGKNFHKEKKDQIHPGVMPFFLFSYAAKLCKKGVLLPLCRLCRPCFRKVKKMAIAAYNEDNRPSHFNDGDTTSTTPPTRGGA